MNRKSRNEFIFLQPTDFQLRCQEHALEKGHSFQEVVLRNLVIQKQKHETRTVLLTIYENQLKMHPNFYLLLEIVPALK